MSLPDLGLHLGEQRGLLSPETAKPPCLALPCPFPFPFPSLSLFLSLLSLQILLRGMDLSFLLWLSQPGAGTGSLAPHSSHLPPHCKSSR